MTPRGLTAQKPPKPGYRRAERGEAAAFVETASAYTETDCLLWPFGCGGSGYPHYNRGDVHVVLCERRHGDRPSPRHEAAHRCGVKRCVNPEHLYWATYEENSADRVLHGTSNRGERQGSSKLTADAVLAIRAGGNPVELAAHYGICLGHIYRLRRGEQWAWL